MNCRTIHEHLPDVAQGITPAPPEVEAHLAECRDCARTMESLRTTMNLLDEWKEPEPSPFWDVRMKARLREEQQKAPAGWLQWFRRPVFSVAAALSLLIGIGVYQAGRFLHEGDNPPENPVAVAPPERRSLTCNFWTRIQTCCRTSTPLTTWTVTRIQTPAISFCDCSTKLLSATVS